MPAIAPHYFNVRLSDVSGDTYTYKADVSVSSRGEFSVRIPDDLVPACKEVAKDGHGARVATAKGSTRHVVYSAVKGNAIELIEKAIKVYCSAETTEEIVIAFTSDAEGMYVAGPNGEIATDAYDVETNFTSSKKRVERLQDGWEWREREHNHFGNRDVFKFGIGAQVYKKTTIKRTTGTTLKYDLYYGEDASHFDRDTYCQRLNAFNIKFGLRDRQDIERSRYREIPYTEDGAKFFYDAMVSLCVLNERVRKLFGDTALLQKAIESRTGHLLPAKV